MVYTRFVEIGRVAYIAFGPNAGKLITVVDVIDQNRVLADGPCTGVARQSMNLKRLHLTKFVLPIAFGARTGTVKKAWEKADIATKWAETTWAKKLANKARRLELTDFDRFKLMKAKQARNLLIRTEVNKLKSAAKGTATKPRRTNKKPSKK